MYCPVTSARESAPIRKLLDACVSFFSGFQTLRLEVEAQNEKGMDFYLKQGFRETSRKEQEVEGISLEVVEMEKKIEESC